ncbi:transport and golgi organization 2 domain-containing protein [Ditylenchus destructor]|uniref:Transport and golgi organization 2 domain-containing protein n=1 Tax=Ditylenchus destructor TaxID=166010 RepID=A0AAD4NF34_9BILA|nr:transport and golgi organization 2 domain-containing protein [Ditylenchus destructor]
MCVTFISTQILCNRYKLVILNNRDEEFDRETSKLAWRDGILSGRDEQANERGTWLGITQSGKIGNLLSITESKAQKLENAPSRGQIVQNFLKSNLRTMEYCTQLAEKASIYNGFQFLGFERDEKGIYQFTSLTNRLVQTIGPVQWQPGIYGFGNSPPSHPFKKVTRGERLFKECLSRLDLEKCSENELIEELMKLSKDGTLCFPDEQIKLQTGVSEDEKYKYLCSLFVRYPKWWRYGTRSHSILLVDVNDNVTFYEQRMMNFPEEIEDAQWETTVERFHIT